MLNVYIIGLTCFPVDTVLIQILDLSFFLPNVHTFYASKGIPLDINCVLL